MPVPGSRLPLLTHRELAALPAQGTLVLTVNNRLARQCAADMASDLGPQRRAAELPRILPLSAWLIEEADALTFRTDVAIAARRLDAFGSQWLWAQTIAQCEAEHPLLDVSLTARLAADADRQMDEWRLAVPTHVETTEYRRFRVWRAAYRERLAARDAEDTNQGYETVLAALRAGQVRVPPRVVLAGFGDVSPRLQLLLDGFQQGGAQCYELGGRDATPTQPVRLTAGDHYAEWQAAADWAAQRLRDDPAGRYAIVAASLEDDAPLARRVLARTLRDAEGQALPFNVAVGRPLAEWSAVRAALCWLRTLAAFDEGASCPVSLLGQALLAGHCAGESSDNGAHAALDVQWRRRQQTALDLVAWTQALSSCPMLGQAWAAARKTWQDGAPRMDADAWAGRIRAALSALGFPGERPLDSVAYQVCEAFDALLVRYTGLAVAVGELDGTQAVSLLGKLAQAVPFQPQRDPRARLDVLGLLEAEGGRWAGVWVLGLSDEALPAAPRPNPLLPLAVLRDAGAPRATPERERVWAGELYASLCRCAPELIVSHPAMEGERALRPAPLIAALPAASWVEAAPHVPVGAPIEELDDTRGLPLSGERRVSGGLDVLETQARNPLWAYVRHRLGARGLEDYADDATPAVRGKFLHTVLELLWTMLPDQDSLHAVRADGRLAALIEQTVAQAADTVLQNWPVALRELECERARSVLDVWLDHEAQRTPFAIEGVERELGWQRGPLTLTLRLDRLDRLSDDRIVIIDYKTGSRLPRLASDWTRERPVGLQLPFYAAVLGRAHGHAVSGLVLAQIHARDVSLAGVADGDVGMEKVAHYTAWSTFAGLSWDDVLARWEQAVELLADEYAAGVATNTTWLRDDLKYCDALPFLRLEENDHD